MAPGESFDQTGFELPLPPQVAPADTGQGELFGDEFSQPDANDGEPVFWPDVAASRRLAPPTFKPTRQITPNDNSLVDSERPEVCLSAW